MTDTAPDMTLDWNEMARISAAVVREQRMHLDVVGLTRAGKSGNRVEVLIATGDGPEPGRLMLNVTRVTASRFEADLRAALHRALSS